MIDVRSRTLVVALVACYASSGCSFMFVTGPKVENHVKVPNGCSESVGWPVVDTVLAVAEGVRVGYAVQRSEVSYQGSWLSQPGDVILGSLLLGVALASAGYGYSTASKCTEAWTQSQADEERARRRQMMLRRRAANPTARTPTVDTDDEAPGEPTASAPEAPVAERGGPSAAPVTRPVGGSPDAGSPASALPVSPRVPTVRQQIDEEDE